MASNTMGALIWTLAIGLLIGAVAKLLMPGRDPGGCIITMLIGIAGSFIASYLGQAMHWHEQGQPAGFIASVIAATPTNNIDVVAAIATALGKPLTPDEIDTFMTELNELQSVTSQYRKRVLDARL